MVRIHPDPPDRSGIAVGEKRRAGAVAQLGEHLLCKQGVVGSIPSSSTNQRSGVRRQKTKRSEVSRKVYLWFLARRYRLFFNNWEEVKQACRRFGHGVKPWLGGRQAGLIVLSP